MGGLRGVPASQRVHERTIAQELERKSLGITSRRGWGRGVIKMLNDAHQFLIGCAMLIRRACALATAGLKLALTTSTIEIVRCEALGIEPIDKLLAPDTPLPGVRPPGA